MKTNHRRGFKATNHRDQSMWSGGRRLSDGYVGASIGNDFTDGNRGMAKAKSGAKKFLRNQERLDGKRVVRRQIEALAAGEDLDDLDLE